MAPKGIEEHKVFSKENAMGEREEVFGSWFVNDVLGNIDLETLKEGGEEEIRHIASSVIDQLEESERGEIKGIPKARVLQVNSEKDRLAIGIQVRGSDFDDGYNVWEGLSFQGIRDLSQIDCFTPQKRVWGIREKDKYNNERNSYIYPVQFPLYSLFPNSDVSREIKEKFVNYLNKEVRFREEEKKFSSLTEILKQRLVGGFFPEDTLEGLNTNIGCCSRAESLETTKKKTLRLIEENYHRGFIMMDWNEYRRKPEQANGFEIYKINQAKDPNVIQMEITFVDKNGGYKQLKEFQKFPEVSGRENTFIIPITIRREDWPEEHYQEWFSTVKEILEKVEYDPKMVERRFKREAVRDLRDFLCLLDKDLKPEIDKIRKEKPTINWGEKRKLEKEIRDQYEGKVLENKDGERINMSVGRIEISETDDYVREKVDEFINGRLKKGLSFTVRPGYDVHYVIEGIELKERDYDDSGRYVVKIRSPKDFIEFMGRKICVMKFTTDYIRGRNTDLIDEVLVDRGIGK